MVCRAVSEDWCARHGGSSLRTPACDVSADAVPAFCCFNMHQVGRGVVVVLSIAQAGSL
jgi:hypothetical protein